LVSGTERFLFDPKRSSKIWKILERIDYLTAFRFASDSSSMISAVIWVGQGASKANPGYFKQLSALQVGHSVSSDKPLKSGHGKIFPSKGAMGQKYQLF